MDRSRGSTTTLPLGGSQKQERPRNKLQKGIPKHRSYLAKSPRSQNFDTGVKLAAYHAGVVGQPSIPLPPDLSDSKWLEYIRQSGLLLSPDGDLARPMKSTHTPPPPEFSHLRVSSDSHRPSLDTTSSSSSDSPASSTTAVSAARRRAKTPVRTIGQLEQGLRPPLPRSGTPRAITKVHSVELIAEQYRALLESRGGGDDMGDASTGRLSTEQARIASLEADLQEVVLETYPTGQTQANPPSDDGTLVAFEDETVYFKPVSFSPEPPSPPLSVGRQGRAQQPMADNLSLQICVDLLVRELSRAVSERPSNSSRLVGADSSALQIWVMIEAYERLRDSISDMADGNPQLGGFESIFDTWLAALYTIHQSLARQESSRFESDMDGLAETVD